VPPLEGRTVPGATLSPLRWRGRRGQSLAAWLVVPDRHDPSRPGAPAVLALHGWGANASTMWPLVEPLVRAGLAIMLLDASCHGDSGEESFASLPRFAEDLADAAAVLAAQPGVDARRVGLVGHSVGAAAALLHAARATRDAAPDRRMPEVAAVVSLSAFTHPETVMRRWMAQRRLPAGRLAEAIVDEVQQVIGARFDAIAPVNTIGLARGRVMVVHGLDDAIVPVGEARRLGRARPDAELLLVPGDHDLRQALAPHAPHIVGFLVAALAETPGSIDPDDPTHRTPA
jgi:dipeptidyl aminopeptidase/acylaminoacyl peptidase